MSYRLNVIHSCTRKNEHLLLHFAIHLTTPLFGGALVVLVVLPSLIMIWGLLNRQWFGIFLSRLLSHSRERPSRLNLWANVPSVPINETSYTTVTLVSLVVPLCPSMLHYCHRMLIIPWAHATIYKAKVLLSIIVLTGILSINCFGSILGDKIEIKTKL